MWWTSHPGFDDMLMARIFITGSTEGLGRAAAQRLIDEGHDVVVHARSPERAAALADLASRGAGVVVGDLRSAAETRNVAEQVNAIGRVDAVIHNAGVYGERSRGSTPDGHPTILAVNTLAPFILTALMHQPDRLIYLSSSLHRGGQGPLSRHQLDQTPLGLGSGLRRKQAVCHRARLRAGAPRARG